MKTYAYAVRFWMMIVLWAAVACGGPDPSAPQAELELEQAKQSITYGNVVEPENSGHIFIDTPTSYCSGVLHTNAWVITARHCLSDQDLGFPARVNLWMGSQFRRAAEIIVHPQLDVALIRASDPFRMMDSYSSFRRPLYPLDSSLHEQVLNVYGYGEYTPGTGIGTLRQSAHLVRQYADSPQTLWFYKNYQGQIMAPGDSGGASLVFSSWIPSCFPPYGCITGISYSCYFRPDEGIALSCTQVAAASFRDWVAANIRPLNAAAFVSQSPVPTELQPGQQFTVSMTLRNTGSMDWELLLGHSLGSQAPQDNGVWGVGRIALPYWVPVNQTATFTATFTAPRPTYTTDYDFQWRMLQEYVEWFGDYTPRTMIKVRGVQGDPPPPPDDGGGEEDPEICRVKPWMCNGLVAPASLQE